MSSNSQTQCSYSPEPSLPPCSPNVSSCCSFKMPQILKLLQQNTTVMSLSDFMVLAKIGEGAYSSVHKVKRLSDGNIYALKKVRISGLKEKEKENALNEVRLLASISCDFVVKYKEAFFDSPSNTLCIVIEYADGGDLEKVIERKKKALSWFEERDIWTMVGQTLNGLSVLHERNIIHRDMKSANIFIAGEVYKIADLNVSKLMKKDLAYTQTGTPYYASPEVWQDKPYEMKSDIWSFGCIVYELCTLKPPFTATSMEGLFKKVMKGAYPKIPANYSDRLARVIDLCLQLDPAKRPSARELLKIVEEGREGREREGGKSRASSVNLLSTIKIPKNYGSWKDELPKANYGTEPPEEESTHPKFGHINQNRLREIVRMKNEENNLSRKDINKKNDVQNVATLRQYDLRAQPERAPLPAARKAQLDVLPRIKIHSEPNYQQKVGDLLLKLREQEKRRYEHNRPTWWG